MWVAMSVAGGTRLEKLRLLGFWVARCRTRSVAAVRVRSGVVRAWRRHHDPLRHCPTSIARHFRVKRSSTVSVRNCRPSASWSATNSVTPDVIARGRRPALLAVQRGRTRTLPLEPQAVFGIEADSRSELPALALQKYRE